MNKTKKKLWLVEKNLEMAYRIFVTWSAILVSKKLIYCLFFFEVFLFFYLV